MTQHLANVPWIRLTSYLFLSTFVLGNVATCLRYRCGWHDGYSRKLNHFGHMVISTPLLAFLPARQLLPAVVIGSVAVVVIYGVSSSSDRAFVHGIVAGSLRDRDKPRERFFFFLPLITGNIGLVVAVFCFPLDFVRVAFFTVAFSDGFAEPVGLRFGERNRFYVRDPIWRHSNSKSVAGCCAVFCCSFAIALASLNLWSGFSVAVIGISASYAASSVVIEAVSPRGLDNMLLFLLCPPVLMGLEMFV